MAVPADTAPEPDTESPHREHEQVVEVTGVEAACEMMSDAYANMRIEAGAEPAWIRLASATLGPVQLQRIGFRMASKSRSSRCSGTSSERCIPTG
ncbi:hypothetical protein AB0C38_26200 [Amycolatopsis sp. NPDC048633]|uniref:hypothetical protein n=1 Tax=Amycolatopsis sp. NPDC048633 TaxID=3157095 RepID=UPI0033F16EAF